VVDFLVHVMLALEGVARRNFYHIQSRDILQPIELNEGALTSQSLPETALGFAPVGNVPAFHNRDIFALHKPVVGRLLRRLGPAHINHKFSFDPSSYCFMIFANSSLSLSPADSP